jgi:5'-3' exonuclease
VPPAQNGRGREIAATRGVVGSVLGMLEGGVTYVGVATDHVVESFRNEMWPGYKTSAGMDPELLQQFPLLEDALMALGVYVWPMVELEADDALGAAAVTCAASPEVDIVYICSPDKDLCQCVRDDRVVTLDRRKNEVRNADGVVARFGVRPESIPDYLALVGDSADGFPGLPGWGAKTAALVLATYKHIEAIPLTGPWAVTLRGADKLQAVLREQMDRALLFRDLATLRTSAPVLGSPDQLRWRAPTDAFKAICAEIVGESFIPRVARLAAARG